MYYDKAGEKSEGDVAEKFESNNTRPNRNETPRCTVFIACQRALFHYYTKMADSIQMRKS